MNLIGVFTLVSILSFAALGSLPAQFAECLYGDSSKASFLDIKAIAQTTAVTYCQTNMGMTNKLGSIELLKTKNVQLGVSLAKTSYGREDLMEMADAGTYVLYVDSGRIAREYLAELLAKNVQLVVTSADAGMSKYDLLFLAKTKSFIYHVNSPIGKDDLKELAKAQVQLVLRSGKQGLIKEDITELSKLYPGSVMLVP